MTTPADLLRALDALDPDDPDSAPQREALRRQYIEARRANAEPEPARVSPSPHA